MLDDTKFLVLYPDESRGFGSGPSSLIPTSGAAATAVDQYRTIGVHASNLQSLGGAFTDVSAVAAISRIAEGGISDVAQLEAAETALQALLLHEIVHVLVPCPKIDFGTGVISYRRQDENQRTSFGFELFSLVQSRDWLIAPEFATAADGVIRASTLPKSPLVGARLDAIDLGAKYWNDDVADAINVTVGSIGAPGYFTDPSLIRSRRGDGFSKRFYHRIQQSWNDATGDIPPIISTFSLPPLLAIVLNRLNNRADLHRAICDLRVELAPVRAELLEFNNIVTQSTSNAEIERRVRLITESFDAIIPESRLSNAERRLRKIVSVQRLIKPIIKFAMGYVMKSGASLDDGLKVVGGVRDFLVESNAVVDRTITAHTFVGLVKTESLQSLIKHHFSEAEIAAIERSMHSR